MSTNFSSTLNNSAAQNTTVFWDDSRIISFFCMVTISIVGTIGNILVIGAIALEKRLRTQSNVFIVNLALADLTVTGCICIIVANNMVADKLVLSDIGCTLTAFVTVFSSAASIASLVAIAVDRYLCICRNELYRRYVNKKVICLLLSITWISPVLLIFVSYFNKLDSFTYDPATYSCTIIHDRCKIWRMIIVSSTLFGPISGCSFLYYKVYAKVRKSTNRVLGHSDLSRGQLRKRDLELLKSLLAVCILFFVSWGPYGIGVGYFAETLRFGSRDLQNVYRGFWYLGLSNSMMNCFVYGLINRNFRSGYVKVLKGISNWRLLSSSSTENQK